MVVAEVVHHHSVGGYGCVAGGDGYDGYGRGDDGTTCTEELVRTGHISLPWFMSKLFVHKHLSK